MCSSDAARAIRAVVLASSRDAPAGHEKHWLRTILGKGFFAIFRLYGPTQPYYEQTWKLPDIERVK